MEGSSEPSQQSLVRAVSSVRVVTLNTEPPEEQALEESAAEEPITEEAPTDTAAEETPIENERRSGEGDEQPMSNDVENKPVDETGEGGQFDGDVVMSLREPTFPSLVEEAVPKSEDTPMLMEEVVPETVAVEAQAASEVTLPIPASREESARRFKYFHPPEEPRKRAPMPVFFNCLAVTPAVILPASMEPGANKALKNKYGSKINIPCGGKVPCHGKARRQWEEERALWVREESSIAFMTAANNALQSLPDDVRLEMAAEAARRRKLGRSPSSGQSSL